MLCNNCNGGIISHDLGLQFRAPTVNMFFYSDHFLRFCESFEYYIAQPLIPCENPRHKPEIEYPVCNLGDLELRGFEEQGLGVLSQFDGLRGKRVIDQFDYVNWFNEGMS